MTLRILVIDDIRDNLTVLKAVIEDAFPTVAVYTALNGKDGIALASTVDPDVILLDIIMPGMDGFEVCSRIKHNKQLKHIPIVFLTALKTSAESRIKALKAGTDGFLSKPVEREELIAEIKAMVKVKAAEERKKTEKARLENMVEGRTAELEEEIKLRINTEQDLRESEEKYRTAFRTIPSAAAISKLDGTYVDINEGFTKITGYTKKDIVGKTSTELEIWAVSEERDKLVVKLTGNRHVDNMEALFRCKDGSLKTGLLSANLITIQGEPYILSITHDITSRKKMLAELISAKDKAEESDRLKTAFLQNMSHEIRTPLNGILGFADLLTGDTDINETKTYAEYIRTSGNRLLSLINNILDLSRIEAGGVSVRLKPFLVNRLMKEAWQLFQIEAKKKDIRFKYHFSLKDDESILVSDENKINQVIINLLGNAFKFTGSGSIDFGYKISGDELLFWVTDKGRGIAPEHQARIFERFYQADISITRDFEGAGLGLPISKGLIELLGGKMWLESQVDKGTSFYFTIPYHVTNKRSAHHTEDKISIRIKDEKPIILIVEDDETSFLFLEIVLRLEKLKMLHATSGPEAIEMSRNHPEIGLVLMDIKLPGMNGLEATRKIKAFRPDLPVIAQTAHAFSSDRQEALDAGCNDFITKPIPKNELVKIVAKYLG